MKLRNRHITGRVRRKVTPSLRVREAALAAAATRKRSSSTIKRKRPNENTTITTTTTTTTTTSLTKGTIMRVLHHHHKDVAGELEAFQNDLIEVVGPSQFSGRVRARLCRAPRKIGIIQVDTFLTRALLEDADDDGDQKKTEKNSELKQNRENQPSAREQIARLTSTSPVRKKKKNKTDVTPPRGPKKRNIMEVHLFQKVGENVTSESNKKKKEEDQSKQEEPGDSGVTSRSVISPPIPPLTTSSSFISSSSSSSSQSSSSSSSSPSTTNTNTTVLKLRGHPIHRKELFQVVRDLGGYHHVVSHRKWQDVRRGMGLPESSSSGSQLKKAFMLYFDTSTPFTTITKSGSTKSGSTTTTTTTTTTTMLSQRNAPFTSHVLVAAPTESHQKGTEYRPLAHVVYKPPIRMTCHHKAAQLTARRLITAHVPVVTMPVDYRTNTRYLVAGTEERAEILKNLKVVAKIQTLANVVDELSNGDFVVLHFKVLVADKTDDGGGGEGGGGEELPSIPPVVLPATARRDSNCQVTFRVKKGVAGTGGLIKEPNGQKLYTLTVQLDLYVSRDVWRNMSHKDRSWCSHLIHEYERAVAARSKHRNENDKGVPGRWSLHYTSTRNSFDHKLRTTRKNIVFTTGAEKGKERKEERKEHVATLQRYYFDGDGDVPSQYDTAAGEGEENPVGVTTLHDVFTDDELRSLETHVESLSQDRAAGILRPNTYHCTYKRFSSPTSTPTRTKFFFGVARYLWGGTDPDPLPSVAAGIRTCDCDPARKWMRGLEQILIDRGIVKPQFVNQFAVNIYHDGSEGLAQHYDDAKRFEQPIISIRLFSDSRLSFGSKYYYYHDTSFFIPMPRGAITILEANSFAANKISHCVRSSDMEGRSAVIVLRRVKEERVRESNELAVERMCSHFDALDLIRNTPFVPPVESRERRMMEETIRRELNRMIKKVEKKENGRRRRLERDAAATLKREAKELKRVVNDVMEGVVVLARDGKTQLLSQVHRIQVERRKRQKL